MNVVGRVSSIITAGVYSVATPFHPFGGAVDIIAVKQQDGSFRCTPWYVRFGKFQGVLKGSEKVVRIQVNGVEADFHMYLDNSGEAYFVREADADKESESNRGLIVSDEGLREDNGNDGDYRQKGVLHTHETNESIDSDLEMQDERVASGVALLDRTESGLYEFYDVQSSLEDSINLSEYGSGHYENLDTVEHILESQSSSPEVVLVSVDGHILTAPISSSDNTENVELSMPRFHLGPGESADFCKGNAKFSTGKAKRGGEESPHKQFVRTNIPTSDQIASLNLKEGQNTVSFIFSTRVLGEQKVEAHMYLWKWNARIVISDVDGTITKSDVLGQFMPLVGKDWTHSGIARLYSAIKENGYQLLFLSARAIVQAYLTRSFLFNLKQDGQTLPNGPVVISPDGLFPSLYREVIKRAPHEFKIACLQDIKALFPPDYNPFYAGFGNRDTDELSYRRIGIPKGKIFIINPKGEVAISHRLDVKSYTSLHTLVNDMFPPTSMIGQEDFNDWNHWKMPLPEINGRS